jgi:quercetin dioxygenase-like cupin family protein
MYNSELKKSTTHNLKEIIEYVPNSVVTRTILRKTTGKVSMIAVASGKTIVGKLSPFDNFIQVIEGTVEIVIDEKSSILKTGEGIIIPAHTSNNIKAKERFKMISTIIKSGYEALSI